MYSCFDSSTVFVASTDDDDDDDDDESPLSDNLTEMAVSPQRSSISPPRYAHFCLRTPMT